MKTEPKDEPIRKTWPKVSVKYAKGVKGWKIDARKNGNGKEHWRKDRAKALELAATIAAEYDDSGAQGMAMPIALRAETFKGLSLVQPFGKSILDACVFYAEHLKARQKAENSALVSTLASAWYDYKRSGKNKKLRAETLRGIKQAKEMIINAIGAKRILDVETADVQAYLDKQRVEMRRKFNINSLFSQFFNWCISAAGGKHIRENPCDGIEITVDGGGVSILTPEQAQNLLDLCVVQFPAYVLYNAIQLFGGLRPEEAQFLQWEQIDMDERTIHVLAETSKIKRERWVHFTNQETLNHWLTSLKPANAKGYVTPQTNFKNATLQIHIAADFRGTLTKTVKGEKIKTVHNPKAKAWPIDVLRHSFGTYWLPVHNNIYELAEEMGNSPKMIKTHYQKPTPKHVAAKFWEIVPKAVAAKREREKAKEDEIMQQLLS